jgi:hypothetical protein
LTTAGEQPPHEEELVPTDDRVIGRAFKGSVAGLGIVALLAGGAWWLLRERTEAVADAPIATAPPVAARSAVTPPTVTFTDITAASGIRFSHFTGATGGKLLPETMGGGGAFFDLDRDGDSDLLLVNGASWPGDTPKADVATVTLYRNDGRGNFVDVSATHTPRLRFYGMGVAVGDYDGDGWTDAFLTGVGESRLLRNEGGRLVDATARSGAGGNSDDWSTGATFFDADGDGDLDLFVCNYVRWSAELDRKIDYRLTGIGRAYGPPLDFEGAHSVLYRNEGDGSFVDVSREAGLHVDNAATGRPVGKALAVIPTDPDGDGSVDLLVANDTVRNFFFRNRGDGTFEETGETLGVAYDREGAATGAMGVDAGYYRNDGELGVAIGNFANEMTSLYVSQGDPGLFADEAITEGIGPATRRALSFGILFFDYDLDGRLDLLQSNGHLEEAIDRVDPSQTYRQVAQLFWNAGADGDRSFVLVPAETAGDLARPLIGRGSAFADVDGDGDLDVLLLQAGGPALFLRNEQRLGNHWLRVRLVGKAPNRDALGARLELVAEGVTQRRYVTPSRSYLSQSELAATFGLGEAERVDSLTVVWPDGSRQEAEVPGVDRVLVIEQVEVGGAGVDAG